METTFKTVLMTFLLSTVFGSRINQRIQRANEMLRNLRPSWCDFTFQRQEKGYTPHYNCSDLYYTHQTSSTLRLPSLPTIMENVKKSRGLVCFLQRRMLNDFSDSTQCCTDGPVADKIKGLELKLLQLWRKLNKTFIDPVRNIGCTSNVPVNDMPERINKALKDVKIMLNSFELYHSNFAN